MIIYIEFFLFYKLITFLSSLYLYRSYTYEKLNKKSFFLLFLTLPSYYFSIAYLSFNFIPFVLCYFIFYGSFLDKVKKVLIILLIDISFHALLYVIPINTNFKFLLCGLLEVLLVLTIGIHFKKRKLELNYPIIIKFPNKALKLRAFFDTGFFAYFKDKPLIIISKKYWQALESCGEIVLKTANSNVVLTCYNSECVIINDMVKECFVAFSDIEYEAIIGYSLL